jgi:hypothetical protein
LIGLVKLLKTFPDHPEASDWKTAIRMYAKDYLFRMSERNRFGLVPLGLFKSSKQNGRRPLGSLGYRYFMAPGDGWWVGINANIASAGVGLARAARILDRPELAGRAQRQLDWILGVNPLGSSTMVGVGHNHPERFLNQTEFSPPTPELHGAVMNGLGGTQGDVPMQYDGSYHTAEYWTPMLGYTMWLMAELLKGT